MAVKRDMLATRELHSVSWVDTASQLADCLTKWGASTQRLRGAIACWAHLKFVQYKYCLCEIRLVNVVYILLEYILLSCTLRLLELYATLI